MTKISVYGYILLGIIFLSFILPNILGVQGMLLRGYSMYPELRDGDFLVVDVESRDYKVNDTIIFMATVNQPYRIMDGNIIIAHKIVDIRYEGGKLTYITRGVNNMELDATEVSPSSDRILGKVIYGAPGWGYLAQWESYFMEATANMVRGAFSWL